MEFPKIGGGYLNFGVLIILIGYYGPPSAETPTWAENSSPNP